jgi:hypothetical protein
MPERPAYSPQDEGWRDIHLEDLIRGAGALITFVSDVAAQLGSAVNQTRTPAARPFNNAPRFPYAATYSPPQTAPAVRAPLVELFDEGEEIILVVEWPDGDVGQLSVSVEDDVLSLAFGAGAPNIDLLLPALVNPSSLRQQTRNGIAEIRLGRA